jgi:hypothetical protein
MPPRQIISDILPLRRCAGHAKSAAPDLVSYVRERGFELYDIASLSGRSRDYRLRVGDAVFVRRSVTGRMACWSNV